MSVLLYPNPMKDTDLSVTRKAVDLIHRLGGAVLLSDEFKKLLPDAGAIFLPLSQAVAKCDQVVTVGGDGTLLRAGNFCIAQQKPVLGINLGRTGFLATCEVDEMERKLAQLLSGQYEIELRNLLQASCTRDAWEQIAINDVTLFGASRLHPMDYTIYCGEHLVSRYRSDGVIVATPTGSTAYSLSAGGPVLDVAASVIVITPICAHGAQAVPLVLAASRTVTLVTEQENREDAFVCADSQGALRLKPGDAVTVKQADRGLPLIRFDGAEQFRAIDTKLIRR